MDAARALDRLREISSQVRAAVVFDAAGEVLGSTLDDEERARSVAGEAQALLAEAEQRGGGAEGSGEFAQLEVALQGGSVFVVRHAERSIAATTPPEPTVGLVFYDLKSCLRDLDEPAPAAKPTTPKRQRAAARNKTDEKP